MEEPDAQTKQAGRAEAQAEAHKHGSVWNIVDVRQRY